VEPYPADCVCDSPVKSWGVTVNKSVEYRHNAAKCLHLSDQTTDQMIRLGLLDMAQAWLELAERAEKYGQAGLVFEAAQLGAVEARPAV
jgi:hypothetical protein